jgi:hypothetical protein
MGTNALVQFVLQPILIFGVIFHFVVLEEHAMQSIKAMPMRVGCLVIC